MAGLLVRALIRLPEVLRAAAAEGWDEAAARAARAGAQDGSVPTPTEEPSERVMLSSRSMLLVEKAQALASEGRDDPSAVDELVATGEGDGTTLRSAAVWFQESAWNLESRQADLAYRLLTAAIRGDAVRPPSTEAEQRFSQLDGLLSSSRAKAWERLCELEPQLAKVAEDARNGRLGLAVGLPSTSTQGDRGGAGDGDVGADAAGGATAGGSAAGGDAGATWFAAEARLRDRLQPLVGPGSRSDDWLARTAVAYRIAADYVRQLKPR
jgi:hypothetical protein